MKPHGEFDIRVRDRIVEVAVSDAWNAEGMACFIEDFKAAAESLGDAPWAALVDLRDWALSTPDTEVQMDELQSWCIAHGQKYEAVVLTDGSLVQLQMQRYSQLIKDVIEQRYFSEPDAARRWLLARLA